MSFHLGQINLSLLFFGEYEIPTCMYLMTWLNDFSIRFDNEIKLDKNEIQQRWIPSITYNILTVNCAQNILNLTVNCAQNF